ncbi:hypothetical protein ATO12_12635 [Aquimarina atlantica]|uniref:DUF6922 domain-containing protein n=1 Tax=Aquimarina atlantica TaxID=1317122 RepID=A0A023BX35_9FLAO|nr:hypothetical protein ATO12_12635 [Aquimarina atlantica]
MKVIKDITKIFPKHLFWDIDYSKLSIKRDKDIIIPRALYTTTKDTFANDIAVLERLYSKQKILSCLKNTKEHVSNKTCVMVAKRYNVTSFYRYAV